LEINITGREVIVLQDRLVYDGWLKIYKRNINGKEFDILKNHDAVSAFIINHKEEVLIVKQFRPAQLQVTLEIPAGIMDVEGELPEECIIREIYEETGLSLESNKLSNIITYRPMMGFSGSKMHVFMGRVDKVKGEQLSVKDEEILSAHWVPMEDLKHFIEKGEIFDSKTLMAYFYYKKSLDII
jgi:ADP-ribose pyrophosphatase